MERHERHRSVPACRRLALPAALIACIGAPAMGVVRNDGGDGPTDDFPFGVQIGDGDGFYCSGTVIANGTHVIMARHCLLAGDDASDYRIMQSDGTVRSGKGAVAIHPQYDVAIFRLAGAVTASVSIFEGSDEAGREIAFAGYGFSATTPGSGVSDLPFGTQRVGANVIEFVATSTNTVVFDFDLLGGVGDGGLGAREATTFTGDSGVGYVTEVAPGEFRLLGVHSGISPNLVNRDQTFSFGVRLSTINDWIAMSVPTPCTGAALALGALFGARRRR